MKSRTLGLGLSFFVFACGSTAIDAPTASESGIVDPPAAGPSVNEPDPGKPGSPSTPSSCKAPRKDEDARDGTPAVAPLDVQPCVYTDYDGVGAVLKVARTFDSGLHALTEVSDRLDEPPRQTEHDQVFVIPPRHLKVTNQYDASGRLVHTWRDEENDGSIESERWWAFDAAGNETTAGNKWELNTYVTTRTFMSGTSFVMTEKMDQTGDVSTFVTWTRKADGSPLTHSIKRGNVVESSSVWTDNPTGTRTQVEHQPIRRTTTITDAAGRVIDQREDQPKDGVDDYFHQTKYNANGDVLEDHTFGKNGEKYGDILNTYDSAGRLVDQWRQWGFGQTNGPTTDVEKRAYDACGQLLSIKRTQNGKPHSEVTRTYDANGYLASEINRRFVPNAVASKETRAFDAQGRLTVIQSFSEVGTTWKLDQTETRTYDANGRLTSSVTTSTTQPTRTETFKYDAKGRLVLHERTPYETGSIVKEEMSYACQP